MSCAARTACTRRSPITAARNRHCPKCQGSQALAWMKQRKSELLDVPYFHVVFTLPARIAAIAYHNKAVVYDLLFKASSQTMRTIAADPKRLGDRLHLGTPHLGLRDEPSSTRPHDRAGWWDIARRHALDRLPSKLSLAGQGVVAAVPPPDAGDAARRTRPPAVLRRPRPPRRQGRVQGLS